MGKSKRLATVRSFVISTDFGAQLARHRSFPFFYLLFDRSNFFVEIMPRAQKPASRLKHDPLHIQLHEDSVHAKYGNVSQPGKRSKSRRDRSESEDEVRSMKCLHGD